MRTRRARAGFHCWLGVVLALLVTQPGCQSGEKQLPMNRASALVNGSIRVDMSRADVVSLLGAPHQIETSGNIEFLFYSVPFVMNAGSAGSNPIAIVDGKVAGTALIYYYKNGGPNSH
jgi:hypothetical protein